MPLHVFFCDDWFLLQEKKILKTHLNCIWNNRKNKIKNKMNLSLTCAAGGLEARSAGLPSRFPAAGPTGPSPFFPVPRGLAQANTARALSSSVPLTPWPHLSVTSSSSSWQRRRLSPTPNSNPRTKGLFPQIDHANTLYKLEPSLACRF
jgi:hypothetical protein